MIAWLIFLSVLLLIIGFEIRRGSNSKIGSLTENLTLFMVAERLSPFVKSWMPEMQIKDLDSRLMWAGQPYGINGSQYIGIKMIFGIIGGLVGLILNIFGLPFIFIILLSIIGLLIPTFVLRKKIEKRKEEIIDTVPNMVGLLSVAINAGVELAPALETISNALPGHLGEELRLAYKEIRTGKQRASAFKDMSKRTGVQIVERFVDTIITAEERGGMSLSESLTEFTYTIREMENKRLQEQAKKLPTKMQLPLFLCIFLPMLIIMLTPVVFTLMDAL